MSEVERMLLEDGRQKKAAGRGVYGRASRTGRVSPSSIRFPGEVLDGRTRQGRAYKAPGPVVTRRFDVALYLATGRVVYLEEV
jgi:hypothetical protein